LTGQERPTYDLAAIKRLVAAGAFLMTGRAVEDMLDMELDREDVKACISALDERPLNEGGHFHKTMPSTTVSGTFQDVYRPMYCGQRLYVKLQANRKGAVVISFHRDDRDD
jgi:hypothetical protein